MEDYSSRKLTYARDKLPALAGLTSAFADLAGDGTSCWSMANRPTYGPTLGIKECAGSNRVPGNPVIVLGICGWQRWMAGQIRSFNRIPDRETARDPLC
jgi:hypothetical protein